MSESNRVLSRVDASEVHGGKTVSVLLCVVGTLKCAIRIQDVIETMRPLPVKELRDLPPYIKGISIIRDRAVPVIDTANLLEVDFFKSNRLVTVRSDGGQIALLFDSVQGIQRLPEDLLEKLPPLLDSADEKATIEIVTLDQELMFVLRGARIITDQVWSQLNEVTSTDDALG